MVKLYLEIFLNVIKNFLLLNCGLRRAWGIIAQKPFELGRARIIVHFGQVPKKLHERICILSSWNFAWTPPTDHWTNCRVIRNKLELGSVNFLERQYTCSHCLISSPVHCWKRHDYFAPGQQLTWPYSGRVIFCLHEWRVTWKDIVLTKWKRWRENEAKLVDLQTHRFVQCF